MTIVPAYDRPFRGKAQGWSADATRRKAPLASADISEKPIRPTAPFKGLDDIFGGLKSSQYY